MRAWLVVVLLSGPVALGEELDAGDAGTVAADAPLAEPDAGATAEVAVAPPRVVEVLDAGPQRETKIIERAPDLRWVAGSAHVITEQQLEKRELDDVHRVLGEVPGVYFREEDGLGLRPNIGLRGVNPDRSSKVTLLEDGVLFGPAPYAAPAAYYFPMVTRMVGLEVYKGPGAIRFGPQTVGGAILLRTAPVPDATLANADLMMGSRGTSRTHVRLGTGGESWGVLGEGVFATDPGFKKLDGGGDTGARHGEVMLKGQYTVAPQATFVAKLGFAAEDSHETYVGISPDDFAADPLRRYASTALDDMRWWRTEAELRWVAKWSEGVRTQVVAYRNDLSRTWKRLDHFRLGPPLFDLLSRNVTGTGDRAYLDVLRGAADSASLDQSLMLVRNERTFISQGIQASANLTGDTGPIHHEAEAGARFHFDQIHRDHTRDGYAMRSGALAPDGQPTDPLADDVGAARAIALHVNDAMSWGRFLLAPGARLEVIETLYSDRLANTATSQWQVVPLLGLGAVVRLPGDVHALAGVHQGFSPVTPGQPTAIGPERAVHFEAGARWHRRLHKAELIGFWSEYSNITGECTGSTGCVANMTNRQFNGGAARILGLELLAQTGVRFGRGYELVGKLSYTFTHASFLTDFTSENPIWGAVVAGDAIPYVPQHQASGRLELSKGPWALGAGVEVQGAFAEEAAAGSTSQLLVPTRVLLDATASWALDDGFTLYVSGQNLTNSQALVARRPSGARPLAPLNVSFGVKARLP